LPAKTPPLKLSHVETRDDAPDILSWGGFLTLKRYKVRNVFQEGGSTPWYWVESVHPPFHDAVVVALYALPAGQDPLVVLRRGVRPSLTLRAQNDSLKKIDGGELSGITWELPAGGVEPGDLEPGGVGLRGRARLEAWEEAGLRVTDDDLSPLGLPAFATPAFCNEKLHYLAAQVDPEAAQPPPGDGHPMEQGGEMAFVPLPEALAWCREGRIMDIKSELGLRRLAEFLAKKGR